MYSAKPATLHAPRRCATESDNGDTTAVTGPLVTPGTVTALTPLIRLNAKVAKFAGWLAVNAMMTGSLFLAAYFSTPHVGSALVPFSTGVAIVAAHDWLFTRIFSGVLVSITAPAPLVKSIVIVCSPLLRFVESISMPSDGFIHRNRSASECTG